MARIRSALFGTAIAVVAVVLAGCSGSSDDASSPSSTPATATASAAVQSAPALTAAPAPAALVTPKAVTDGYGGGLTLAPVTLNRRGSFLLLEVAVTVQKAQNQSVNLSTLFVHSRLDLPVTLIDPVHGKRYLPAKDASGDCLCTNFTGGLTVEQGETAIVSAYFADPPADVTSLDVDLSKVATFTAVPISG